MKTSCNPPARGQRDSRPHIPPPGQSRDVRGLSWGQTAPSQFARISNRPVGVGSIPASPEPRRHGKQLDRIIGPLIARLLCLYLVRSHPRSVTSHAKINRPINAAEIAVIRATLKQAPTLPELPHLADTLEHLRALGCCGCGCDSVDFTTQDPTHISKPIGDGVGTTPAGGRVGVIVWGGDDAITGLEVYSLGAEESDLKLPVPSSIQPFVPDET
jgi:hypothetical protein